MSATRTTEGVVVPVPSNKADPVFAGGAIDMRRRVRSGELGVKRFLVRASSVPVPSVLLAGQPIRCAPDNAQRLAEIDCRVGDRWPGDTGRKMGSCPSVRVGHRWRTELVKASVQMER